MDPATYDDYHHPGMARRRPVMVNDYTHPERHHKDLTFVNGEIPDELWSQRSKSGLLQLGTREVGVELCRACGWNGYNELLSDYGPRIKIFHTRDNVGLWAIGSQWLIRDQPNDCTLGKDYITQKFLHDQAGLTIPLVKEIRLLSEPTDQIQFTLMSRAPGASLFSVWKALTPEQKLGYKDQLTDAIRQWRRFTAPRAQAVDGSLLDDVILSPCLRRHPPTCKKLGRTIDEWFENIAPELRKGLSKIHKTKDPEVIERKFQELKDNFPKCEPYILTHADLNLTNIIVKDDKITAIIDWEMAGYYPWWAERWLSLRWGDDESDEIFKPLWADVSPEVDEVTFQQQVFFKVGAVIEAYDACKKEHPKGITWLRPGFCRCKPYAGRFGSISMGNPREHKIIDVD